jgi:hypothetical protein
VFLSIPGHRSACHHAKPPIGEEPAKAFSLEPDGSFVVAGVHVVPLAIAMAPKAPNVLAGTIKKSRHDEK